MVTSVAGTRSGTRRQRSAALCGFAAVLLASTTTVVGAAARPGYSHVSQFISELGEVGAASGLLVSAAGFAPTGFLVLLFLWLAWPLFPQSRRSLWGVGSFASVGIAYIVTAVARCDAGCPSTGSLSQAVHNQFGVLQYVGSFTGLVLLGAEFGRSDRWRRLAPVCTLCAALVGVGFVGAVLPNLSPVRGLFQRVAEGGIFLWVAVASMALFRSTRS